jgi:hypothetical protein
VPDVPQALLTVVQRCLRKHPSDRYSNIAQMALELHRVAPRRVRVSARRIAGVFRRAGIETSEGPPSSRRPPVGATVPLPNPNPPVNLPEDTVPTPVEEEVSALRASRGEAYDSDTHVMADRDAPIQERDATTLVMPEATPLPFVQTQASTSASASGPHPAVPMGKAGSSGRYPAVQPDQSRASGEYRAPFQSVPGEGPTFDGLAATDRNRRAVTAQSWQHVLGEPPGSSTSKRIAVIVASAVILCVVVAAVAILGGGSESAPQVTAPASPPQLPLGEGADSESEATSPAKPPRPQVPAASVSVGNMRSSKTGSARSPKTRPRPVPNRQPPVVKSPPAPKPEPPSIFDER